MTVFVCAVADCKSSSKKSADKWPEITNVKGWAKFPSVKREPKRRKLWESRCKRGAGWKATRFHRVCSRHFNNWEETRPSSFHPDPELFNYNDWGKKHSQRSRNVWQSNSDAIQHEIDLVKPDVDVLQQDPVPEPIIIEDVDVIGAEVDIHSNMDQASYLIATPEPHRDHTYSSVSRDTTDASEPVDFGMQISQPVCHAETQTHEMFAHACAAEKNSVLRLSFKEKVLQSDKSVRKYTGKEGRRQQVPTRRGHPHTTSLSAGTNTTEESQSPRPKPTALTTARVVRWVAVHPAQSYPVLTQQ
ncbi:hypothetical protein Pcinc_002721 [Petrolisthes cinctipes]|uniref:THAP-type domain-containing protein n=1 Tax=Petrolisthes cinctipes TaxID=88211 RepID=A0AAE1GHM9_PETCI|nr:hypothetical protein Pcinc_002721 [Petrolisthes cinctipes]